MRHARALIMPSMQGAKMHAGRQARPRGAADLTVFCSRVAGAQIKAPIGSAYLSHALAEPLCPFIPTRRMATGFSTDFSPRVFDTRHLIRRSAPLSLPHLSLLLHITGLLVVGGVTAQFFGGNFQKGTAYVPERVRRS